MSKSAELSSCPQSSDFRTGGLSCRSSLRPKFAPDNQIIVFKQAEVNLKSNLNNFESKKLYSSVRIKDSSFIMLPPKVASYLGKMINFGSSLGFIPYSWNEKRKKFSCNHSIIYWYRFLFQLTVLLAYESFLVFRCVQTWTNEEEKVERKIKVLYMTLAWVFLFVSHVVTYNHYGSHHHLIQNFVDLTKRFKSEYGPFTADCKGADILRFLKLLSFVCSFASVTNAIGVFKEPTSPRLLTSLFPNPKKVPIGIKIPIAFFHFYINSFHYYGIGIYYGIAISFVYAVLPVIKRLSYLEVENDRSLQFLLTPAVVYKYQNILAVLQRNFNNIFGIWTLGIQIFCITAITLNMFQAVIFDSPRALIVGSAVFVLSFYMYKRFSTIHEVSMYTVETWKLRKNPLWFRKFVKSCQPLSVTMGGFYYADRALVLTMVSIIFTNTVNLIVTYKVD